VFQATCHGARDIVPGAWGGQYPCQVRVQLCSKERIAVPHSNLGPVATIPETLRTRNILFGKPAKELLEYFAGTCCPGHAAGLPLDKMQQEVRFRRPRKFHCPDGHDVRSLSEKSIDEWLWTHQVYHEYERLARIPEHLVPIFTVYTAERQPVFIEVWEMPPDPKHEKGRQRKRELYARHHCALIELDRDDLATLDSSLRTKLSERNVLVQSPN